MSISNSEKYNLPLLPEDKISNKEIINLLKITQHIFSLARKWRPEDFPKGKRSGKSIFYSKKEIVDFFGKYGYHVKGE